MVVIPEGFEDQFETRTVIIQKLEAYVREVEDGHELCSYAAHAAAKVLVQNWSDAIRDGESLKDCVGDVYQVIQILESFRSNCQKLAVATTP